ncbi:MAG: ABC transporter permease [Bacteroidetes bacterium]|nr:ABC transporter permease [Bacteroidota bacterium]
MTKLLKLAWRNVWRNRRRSFITMGAITFSVVTIAVTRSLQYGAYDAMEAYAVRLFTGDVQIHRAGYHEEKLLSFSLLEDDQNWPALLDEQPWVKAYCRRLTGFGLISSDASSAGGMILGVEPEAERQVSAFARNTIEGVSLQDGDDHAALLGQTLARNLDVGVGDTVVVLTQGFRSQMGADLYAVKGLLRTGSLDLDRALMVIPLPAAQDLFAMEGRFTEVVLHTDSYRHDEQYASRLRAALDQADYEVMFWGDLLPELRQAILLDNVSGAVFLMFLLLLIGFEIFNTTTMSVMERAREFGVMQSIGMKPRQISLLVGLELVLKISVALAAGLLITFVLALIFKDQPLPLSQEFLELSNSFGFPLDELELSTRPAVFLEPLVSVLIIAVLAMIYPILKVRRLTPVEALRTA